MHDIINKCEYSNDMKLNGEILEISYSIWTTILFNKRVINPIIQHIHLLLNKMTIAKMRECKYMCLVGGLSNNIDRWKPIIINYWMATEKHTSVKIYQCDEYNNDSQHFFINTANNNNNNNIITKETWN